MDCPFSFIQVEKESTEPAQLEDSSCCLTATAMEETQISEDSDTAGASEDERSLLQSDSIAVPRKGLPLLIWSPHMQVEKAPMEPAQPEDSSCCCMVMAMEEEETQISEGSDTACASEDERSHPQSAHSGRRRGSAARASVIRNRVIQKKYLQRKKVPLLAFLCRAIACSLNYLLHLEPCAGDATL